MIASVITGMMNAQNNAQNLRHQNNGGDGIRYPLNGNRSVSGAGRRNEPPTRFQLVETIVMMI